MSATSYGEKRIRRGEGWTEIPEPLTMIDNGKDETWPSQSLRPEPPATIEAALQNTDRATPKVVSAAEILDQGVSEMKDRASSRDSAATGERSMAKTVKAFNAFTGKGLTESDGWLFMICLKAARSVGGAFRMDDYVDGAAYFGLYGECESKSRA